MGTGTISERAAEVETFELRLNSATHLYKLRTPSFILIPKDVPKVLTRQTHSSRGDSCGLDRSRSSVHGSTLTPGQEKEERRRNER